jgi:adenosylhomocysteine nucleosidase
MIVDLRIAVRTHACLLLLPLLVATGCKQSTPLRPAPLLLQGAVDIEVNRLLDSIQVTHTDTIGAWIFAHGSIDGYPVIVSRTLMGAAHAAAATALAIDRYHPRAILNIGTAGGYDTALHYGDIVIGQSAVSLAAFKSPPLPAHGGSHPLEWTAMDLVPRPGEVNNLLHEGTATQFSADSGLLAAAHRAQAYTTGRKVVDGVIGTSDFWNQELDRIAFFRQHWHVSVEEMETVPAAQVASIFKIPFLGIRVVSDNVPNGELAFDPRTADAVQDFAMRVVHEYLGRL